MRFKQRTSNKLPEVDLIPMLTVMMGVLAFFVVVTLTLGNEATVDLQLPPPQTDANEPPPPLTTEPFIVSLDADETLRLNNQPIDKESLKGRLEAYLARREDHVAYVLPNQTLSYEVVMQFLGEMRAVGGDRVSLAIEE